MRATLNEYTVVTSRAKDRRDGCSSSGAGLGLLDCVTLRLERMKSTTSALHIRLNFMDCQRWVATQFPSKNNLSIQLFSRFVGCAFRTWRHITVKSVELSCRSGCEFWAAVRRETFGIAKGKGL